MNTTLELYSNDTSNATACSGGVQFVSLYAANFTIITPISVSSLEAYAGLDCPYRDSAGMYKYFVSVCCIWVTGGAYGKRRLAVFLCAICTFTKLSSPLMVNAKFVCNHSDHSRLFLCVGCRTLIKWSRDFSRPTEVLTL